MSYATIKIVYCDDKGCGRSKSGLDNELLDDITRRLQGKGWIYDKALKKHYCPVCTSKTLPRMSKKI